MITILPDVRILMRPVAVALGLALFAPSMLRAEVTTYTDPTAFEIELLRLGYTTVAEGFEDDGAWRSP